jgi:hypothetical protein
VAVSEAQRVRASVRNRLHYSTGHAGAVVSSVQASKILQCTQSNATYDSLLGTVLASCLLYGMGHKAFCCPMLVSNLNLIGSVADIYA